MKKLIIDYSEELKALHEKGWQMIEKGQVDKALLLWEKGFTAAGQLYPPSLPDIVQLYTQMGNYERAEAYLDLLEQVNELEEGDWLISIFISRMLLAYHKGDNAGANQYLQKLKVLELDAEDRELLAHLEDSINDATGQSYDQLITQVMMDELMSAAAQELIEDLSHKELPLNAGLGRGLRNLPVHWIDATVELLGLEGHAWRNKREKQIIDHLCDQANLAAVCDEFLDEEEKEILRYLLKNEGWSRFQVVSRLFGGLEGENYFWPEDGPCTAIGTLWSLGLVMVGQNKINGRKARIAVVPRELRVPLQNILNTGD